MKEVILKHALKNAAAHKGKAVLERVLPKVIGEKPDLKKDMKELIKQTIQVISEVNKLSVEEQEDRLKKLAPELLEKKKEEQELRELPNVKGKVVMRFAPFPSGAAHIGNTKGMILIDEYVKKYGGKHYLVFDDTIGSTAKPIDPYAYESIPKMMKWLGIKINDIVYKSDRLKHYYDYAEKMINKGLAYVCECSAELMRDYRAKGIACNHRKQSIKDNMNKWKQMFSKYKPGEAVLRIKTDLKYNNPAFRDRVIMRISDRKHPRVGNKYRVWPLMDFSWAVDDMVLGMTHIFRGKELYIEDLMQRYIWKQMKEKYNPEILHWGLFRIKGVKISKSKSKKEVDSGEYSGWDDPRTWSLESLKRRGIKPEAIREFILDMGVNENDITVPITKLYTFNRRIIDSKSDRYFFVNKPIKLIIKNAQSVSTSIPLRAGSKKYKNYSINGNVELWISEDDLALLKKEKRVRLKDLINVDLVKTGKQVVCKPSHDQAEVYNIRKIHWVLNGIECTVLKPNGEWDYGYCEQYCQSIKQGEIIQFERYGFARLEDKDKKGLKFIYTHA